MSEYINGEPIMLTSKEVARRLRVEVSTVQRFVRDGLLHASKIGRSYLVEEADLKAFIDARKGLRHKSNAPKSRS